MSAEFTSHLPHFGPLHRKGIDKGLVAVAAMLEKALHDAHRGGYTSGTYSEGQVRKAIKYTLPETDDDGARIIRVGIRGNGQPYQIGQKTPASIGQIALFWTLGHHNTYTRKFEQVDKWRPTVQARVNDARALFAEAYQSIVKPRAA